MEKTTVNINMLKGKIIEKGYSISQVAEEMGIDKATLYRKLTPDGRTLTVKDANIIVKILRLSVEEATSIFFAQLVA